MELRFVLRNGEKVLQYKTEEYYGKPYYDALNRRKHNKIDVWVDIQDLDKNPPRMMSHVLTTDYFKE